MSPTLVNEPLLELFRVHGITATSEHGWVTLPTHHLKAKALIVQETKQQRVLSVQLDIYLEISAGQVLLESFGGFGATRDQAVADGFQNFTATSFHVLLAAFFNLGDSQGDRQEWVVGGRPAQAIVGNVGVRGKPPASGDQSFPWFNHFVDCLKNQNLRPGVHWVRLYYAQMQRKQVSCEVLLDNNVWDTVQMDMANYDWPAADDFHSFRIFLVLRVKAPATVAPEEAVGWLAEVLAPRAEFTEEEIYAALSEAGVPDRLADRAYKFTQIAWARQLLAGLGVQFSPRYFWLDGAGEIVESGQIAEDPTFVEASRLAERYAPSPGFRRLVLMSADVHAVNKALQAGSKPEDLVTSPACLFLEPPTEAGMARARQVITQQLTTDRPARS